MTTGQQSDKAFRMPNGEVEEASDMDKLQHDVRHPAKDVHIVPGIERDSLLSIPKFTDANYVAIFDKDEVNIYDANKTTIVVSRGAILRGWQCKQTNLWQIPLIKNVTNKNTNTVLCLRSMPDGISTRQTTARRSNPQRVRAKNTARNCAILPRGGGFPNQTVMVQGHQKQTICIMAGPHMGGGQQELPRVRRDIKRPRAQDEERITMTKKKSKKLRNLPALQQSRKKQSSASTTSVTKPSA
jgi:hypothetical protein